MTQRFPLVFVAGRIKELTSSDSIPGPTDIPQSVGNTTIPNGFSRIYPSGTRFTGRLTLTGSARVMFR